MVKNEFATIEMHKGKISIVPNAMNTANRPLDDTDLAFLLSMYTKLVQWNR